MLRKVDVFQVVAKSGELRKKENRGKCSVSE